MTKTIKNLFFAIMLALFAYTVSAELVPYDADGSGYPADKYLVTEHLMTNLHFSEAQGKRPLILMFGGSGRFISMFPKNPEIVSLRANGVHVMTAEYHIDDGWFYKYYPDFPRSITKIRLESFVEELNKYLEVHRDRIDTDCIGVFGTSKGGELALLLGSYFPQFKFVVGIVPSNVAFQSTKISLFKSSSWSYQGQEVPFVPYPLFSWKTISGVFSWLFGSRVDMLDMHIDALKNKQAVDAATIRVENINGPVFLLSGQKDPWWPSTEMSNLVMQRLEEKNFPHLAASSHVALDADHFVGDAPGYVDLTISKILQMIEYSKSR